MTATVFYDNVNEQAILSVAFALGGVATDPTTVTCVVTDPAGLITVHTYLGSAPADVAKSGAGAYQLVVPCVPSITGVDGLWGYNWVAAGTVSDIQPGTWRVLPANTSQLWYVGLEEMKDRLSITDNADDSVLQTAIAATAGWINTYTARHFNRVTEARTFVPYDIYELDIDDLAGPPTSFAVDFNGDGIYEQAWTLDTDYQLYYGKDRFNLSSMGIARPYEKARVITSGKTFPFTWPFSPLNRVQITGPWGWPAVPAMVPEANRILAADLFKMKDAPFGVAGVSDIGLVRIQSNPWLVEMLRPFVKGKRKAGMLWVLITQLSWESRDVRPDHRQLRRADPGRDPESRQREPGRAGPVRSFLSWLACCSGVHYGCRRGLSPLGSTNCCPYWEGWRAGYAWQSRNR